ncbi:hypothetical protein P3G55_13700 [Leptospira sp. 96542]|nr:hypothetical protein [Leptospira sp. 96542]
MKQDIQSLNEFSKQLKSGSIYKEIDSKLTALHKKKSKTESKSIDGLREKIEKKEKQIERLYGEIISLQNKLSKLLDEELKAQRKS